MSVTLPDLGTNGLVNSVRKISGLTNPGYRAVDPSTEFIAGMVAKLTTDSNGNPMVTRAADTDKSNIIGLFFSHKTTSFYRAVVAEAVTFAASPNTATVGYLKHANLLGSAGTYVMVSSTATVVADYTYGASTNDFTLSYTNGTITRHAAGKIAAASTVYVTYMYADPNLVGIDETLGSGLTATLEEHGEVATLVYDTTHAYTIMGPVYCNASGYITSYRTNTADELGRVTKVPTNESPELHFKLVL